MAIDRRGLALSAALHVVLVAVLILSGCRRLFHPAAAEEMPIAVQLVTIAPETRATQPNPFNPRPEAKPEPPVAAPAPKPEPKPEPPQPAPDRRPRPRRHRRRRPNRRRRRPSRKRPPPPAAAQSRSRPKRRHRRNRRPSRSPSRSKRQRAAPTAEPGGKLAKMLETPKVRSRREDDPEPAEFDSTA